jgi:hypothetical protein
MFNGSYCIDASSAVYIVSYSQKQLKRQGRKADSSPPTSAEVKNVLAHTSTSPYVSMAYCFTFFFCSKVSALCFDHFFGHCQIEIKISIV